MSVLIETQFAWEVYNKEVIARTAYFEPVKNARRYSCWILKNLTLRTSKVISQDKGVFFENCQKLEYGIIFISQESPIKYWFSSVLFIANVSRRKFISLTCCFNIYFWQISEIGLFELLGDYRQFWTWGKAGRLATEQCRRRIDVTVGGLPLKNHTLITFPKRGDSCLRLFAQARLIKITKHWAY